LTMPMLRFAKMKVAKTIHTVQPPR
jgi:hypothetical protein